MQVADPILPERWDIFCRVVDNFGDIGVCWRLARQLAGEHRLRVRVWLDDMSALAKICGSAGVPSGNDATIEVSPWEQSLACDECGDVVVEAFGCGLPDQYLARMVHRSNPPLWINLEYLSAETWIDGCHGLPSPHPHHRLNKYFFFPGFSTSSGGLLREQGLLRACSEWQMDVAMQDAWWLESGGIGPWNERFNISLFTYDWASISGWLDLLAADPRPTRLLVPEGPVLPNVEAWLGRRLIGGEPQRRGHLECHGLPFVSQDAYDRLLWSCDLNLVRGEDSFVRAQWAGRPFMWHIYRQQEDAHMDKLDAFLARYLEAFDPAAAEAVSGMWHALNRGTSVTLPWRAWRHDEGSIGRGATAWRDIQAGQQDLAGALVQFCKHAVKC